MHNKILLIIILLLSTNVYGVEIVKSIDYKVSSDLSLNQAEKLAIQQIQLEAIREIGVLISNELKITKINGELADVHNETSQITSAVSKTKIIKRSYDGETLFIKAAFYISESSLTELINQYEWRNSSYIEKEKLKVTLGKVMAKYKFANSEIEKKDAQLSENEREIEKLINKLNHLEKLNKERLLSEEKLKIIRNNVDAMVTSVNERSKNNDKNFMEAIDNLKKLVVPGITIEQIKYIYPEIGRSPLSLRKIIGIREFQISGNGNFTSKDELDTYIVSEHKASDNDYILGLIVNRTTRRVNNILIAGVKNIVSNEKSLELITPAGVDWYRYLNDTCHSYPPHCER